MKIAELCSLSIAKSKRSKLAYEMIKSNVFCFKLPKENVFVTNYLVGIVIYHTL